MPNTLKFKFDISAYRLLGRELITDRITALFELVKNCYDANATKVTVQFENVNPCTPNSRIILQDDGFGMSLEDIRDKWMVIGTSSKRKIRQSPPPFNRKVIGKKGVGRFAVDKLGAKLLLKTTQKGSEQLCYLETDWTFYEEQEKRQLKDDPHHEDNFFTDIENKYWTEQTDKNSSFTILEISAINDFWAKDDITHASKELSKLILPSHHLSCPFKITIKAPEYEEYENYIVETKAIDLATQKFILGYDRGTSKQEILFIDEGELKTKFVDERPCGLLRFTLYYFDQSAKSKYRKMFPDELVDGIKVYRDGVIATPFAEHTGDRNEKKDLFGIDKRRWSGFFDKLSSRDILGWIEIFDEFNPNIIDATNRQNFVDNEAWRELKAFTIEQISQIERYLKEKKKEESKKTTSEFKTLKDDIGAFRKQLNAVKEQTTSPDVKKTIAEVERGLAKTQATAQRSLTSYKELEKEKKQQENLFYSLVSLQRFSGMISHITRTSIGRIKRAAEFIHKWMPNPRFNEEYKRFSSKIFSEMGQLENAVDFMLKYAKDDGKFEEINVKESIEHIFNEIYLTEFLKREIKTTVEVDKELIINYNPKSFEDIFDNLISNSFKALEKTTAERFIKCSAITEKDKFTILFSDNGCGIPEKNKYRIFDVFFTTTAEQGGAGLGLFIVKSRLEALKGTVQVVENELKPTGATFKIEFPFKR